jgi:hypothetical protein
MTPSGFSLCNAAGIAEEYPWLVENGVLDVIFPKKEVVVVAKGWVGCSTRVVPPLLAARTPVLRRTWRR